jgi:hypothetical protein
MATPLDEQVLQYDKQAADRRECTCGPTDTNGDNAASLSVEEQRSAFSPGGANDACSASFRNKSSNISITSQQPDRTAAELNFFDPSNVNGLKQTMTKASQGQGCGSCSDSELTLNCLEIGDGPFNLERFLRTVMKQCVIFTAYSRILRYNPLLLGLARPRISRLVKLVCSSKIYALSSLARRCHTSQLLGLYLTFRHISEQFRDADIRRREIFSQALKASCAPEKCFVSIGFSALVLLVINPSSSCPWPAGRWVFNSPEDPGKSKSRVS